jgi:hypothetical protein
MRRLLVLGLAVPYLILCIVDLAGGRPRTGVAAGLLAVVNVLLYWE